MFAIVKNILKEKLDKTQRAKLFNSNVLPSLFASETRK